MPLLRKKTVLAAKIETTPGTLISLGNSDGVFNVYDAQIVPNIQMTDREGQGAYSKLPSVVGKQSGTCTFSTDLTIGTSLPSWASTFLPACGLAVTSTTFSCKAEAPGSTVKTLTIGHYVDGILYRLTGASGTFTATFTAGEKITLNFTFTGVFDSFESEAILSPTYPTATPALRWANSTSLIDSVGFRAGAMTFDLGNTVSLLESQSSSNGFVYALITDRKPMLSVDVEMDASDAPTRFGQWLTSETMPIAWDSDTLLTTGKWAFSIPAAQVINQQPGERSGVLTENLNFMACRSSANNDEFTMTYTLGT